ncbi:MAG: DUF924 domain-containing protein [Siculibacillus sp.]|nr:DUF924 domain-containing protein [Siculibacillus sp.]
MPPSADLATAVADLPAYWFGDLSDAVAVGEGDLHLARWWSHDPAIDSEIDRRFGALAETVATRFAAGWRPADPATALATVVALDQLPRNIHRGTPAMYARDDLAVAATRHALTLADPLAGDLFRAVFSLMPLMHSERFADQEEMVDRFEALAAEAERRGSPNLAAFRANLDFARRHRDIVARFGRFPHRNHILGRPSTQEEETFLTEPGSAF